MLTKISPLPVLLLISALFTLSIQSQNLRKTVPNSDSHLNLTTFPIIGIVTLPSTLADYPSEKYSYLPASYVKFIESAGAIVVPVRYDLSSEHLDSLMSKLNGFLFTGGQENLYDDDNFTDYGFTLSKIFNYTVKANKDGIYTPIWGTCLGFEHIIGLVAGNRPVLKNVTGLSQVAKNLTFLELALENSRTLKGIPNDILEKLQTDALAYFNAGYAMNYTDWENNANLRGNFSVVAITQDADNDTIAAYIEAKELPIYGTQFHPEKAAFEWFGSDTVPHSFDAIRFEQWLGNFFVNEARKNPNGFKNLTHVKDHIVENYEALVVDQSLFDEVYIFKNVNYTDSELPPTAAIF